MYIAPISLLNNTRYRGYKPNFEAHPDFYGYNSIKSCFFRRGVVALVNNEGYKNIENVFCKIFSGDIKEPEPMLIIGIGRSQETFSYLASIKGILGKRQLKNNVDLYAVDLQSKPELNELKSDAFCNLFDYETFPFYAEKSFVKDSLGRFLGNKEKCGSPILDPMEIFLRLNINKTQPKPRKNTYKSFRVNDEIFDFVRKTYDNAEKSKWDSRVQEVIRDFSDNKFRIISANNVLGYLPSTGDFVSTVKHIIRTLKPKGYFITDPYDFCLKPVPAADLNKLEKIAPGIYQKSG